MKTDSLARRLRFAEPQPGSGKIALQESDLLLFAAINRHGPLPTNYLHEIMRAHHKSIGHFQWKLTRFYNGSANAPPLLSRPPQQCQSFAARYQHLIYDLTKTSRALLEERGIAIIDRTDPFLHRFMGACVGASIELACCQLGIRYISRAEVLAKSGSTLSIQVGGRRPVPDDLFGLQYPDKSYRFFAVEIDRHTESIERKSASYNTFGGKLKVYIRLMENRAFKSHWSIPNLMVLTVTTNAQHMANIQARLAWEAGVHFRDRFLFKTKSEFGINWRVPNVMSDLLTQPWGRISAPFNIARP